MSRDNPVRAAHRCKMQQRQTMFFSTLTTTLAVIIVIAMLTWARIVLLPFEPSFARNEDPSKMVTPCIIDGSKTTEASLITVNVYSATNRTGIAGKAAKSLKTSGFSVAQTENWGGETTIKEFARIVTSPRGINTACTTARYIPEFVVHYDPSIDDETISVVPGVDYDKVLKAKGVKSKSPKGKLTAAKGCVQASNHGK